MEQLSQSTNPFVDPTIEYVINIPNFSSKHHCPSIDTLIDYKIGRFAPDSEQYQTIRDHVSKCIFCLDLEMFKEMRAH